MEKKKKHMLASTLIAGAVIGTTGLLANSNELFSFDELGSGAEVRTKLATNSIEDQSTLNLEMKCGNKKGKTSTSADSKSKDAKCGEGKCGEKDTTKEGKSKDAKCGEATCGK